MSTVKFRGETHRFSVQLHNSPCRDIKQNKDKRHDKLGLQLNLLHCVQGRMGVDEGNLQVIDVDAILESCPITIPLWYILISSDHCVYNSHIVRRDSLY